MKDLKLEQSTLDARKAALDERRAFMEQVFQGTTSKESVCARMFDIMFYCFEEYFGIDFEAALVEATKND